MRVRILEKYRSRLLECFDTVQFTYRPDSLTACALITIDCVTKFLDDISIGAVRIVTFDMSNTFDCIPHHLLLNCYNLVNWLNSYISTRSRRVKLGPTCSTIAHVISLRKLCPGSTFICYFFTYKARDAEVRVVKYTDDITLIVPICKN